MVEKDAQTVFRDHNTVYGAFELKLCKGTIDDMGKVHIPPLAFNRIADHQREALLAISSQKGFFHKLTDPPVFPGPDMKTRFNKPRPFDCFRLQHVPAYVVVCWYVPRKIKRFFYIEIHAMIEEMGMSERKSLTMQRAGEIAETIMDVNLGITAPASLFKATVISARRRQELLI